MTKRIVRCVLPTCGTHRMPRAVVEDNPRMSLRIRPEQKALLARAAALRQTDLTTFVTRSALREAETIVEAAERIKLSERDSLRWFGLSEQARGLDKWTAAG